MACFIIVTLAAAPVAAAEIERDMRIVIRTYDSAEVRTADVAAAMPTAMAILSAAGLDVEWLACGRGGACSAPLGANEVAVRFVRVTIPNHYRGELPLGYALVDARTRSGALATIYVDRVAWLSAAARVDPRPLLGRAIAHEVGHLLLGTNGHTDAGLMRPVWSCDALRRNHSADWMFAPPDGQAMRQAVRLRAVPQIATRGD